MREFALASGSSSPLFDARSNFLGWTPHTADDPDLRVVIGQTARKNSIATPEIEISTSR